MTEDRARRRCALTLLARLDESVQDSQFQCWDCGDYTAITGAMRASGFASPAGVGLVFERFGYDYGEGNVQADAFCFATFPTADWVRVGEGLCVPRSEMNDPETGRFALGFGEVEVKSRGRAFVVDLSREGLVESGCLAAEAESPTWQAFVFRICDTVPRDWLFSEERHLRDAFGMGAEAHRVFVVEAWEHPAMDAVYGEEIRPSDCADIRIMVEAVCAGSSSPALSGRPNTHWRQQRR